MAGPPQVRQFCELPTTQKPGVDPRVFVLCQGVLWESGGGPPLVARRVPPPPHKQKPWG